MLTANSSSCYDTTSQIEKEEQKGISTKSQNVNKLTLFISHL